MIKINIKIPKWICKPFDVIMDSLEDNFLKAMSIIMGVLSTPFLYTGVNALINNKPDAWVTISYGIFVLTAMPVIFFGIDFLERHISISCKCENE